MRGVKVGSRVLEVFLFTEDRAIHSNMFLLPYMGEHVTHKGSVIRIRCVCVCVCVQMDIVMIILCIS